jgi:hypothetical protein
MCIFSTGASNASVDVRYIRTLEQERRRTMTITWTIVGALGAVIAVAAIAFPVIRRDYHRFLEGGPSYAPQNIRGYIIVLVLALFRQEGLGLAIYDRLPEKRSWLPDLPTRKGPRPATTSHIIQRQVRSDESCFIHRS